MTVVGRILVRVDLPTNISQDRNGGDETDQ